MIKLFEEFSNQYGKISFKEYSLMLQQIPPKVFIPFTDKEKEEISKFGECKDFTSIRTKADTHMIYLDIENIGLLSIYKLPDEWYYIMKPYAYYKCDGFNGVIDCLNYIK